MPPCVVPRRNMSLSYDTGPYFARPSHLGFKLLDLKAAAAAEVHRVACSPQGKRGGAPGSFGQPCFAKALNQQLRVCLPAASDPRRYRKGGIGLKHTRRRLTGLGITSEMGESGRETTVSCRIRGVLTLGFLPGDDSLVKATKLSKG